MRSRLIQLGVAASLATAALAGTSVARTQAALPDIVPDAAYCAYGFVNGVGTFSPPEDTSLKPESWDISLSATCLAATPDGQGVALGDEAGNYQLTLSGSSSSEGCAGAVSGSGTVTGSTPEGAMSFGGFTYHKGGPHYYINGSYWAPEGNVLEPHVMQLWLDVLPLPACPYSSAPVIGHGGFIDEYVPPIPATDDAGISDAASFVGNAVVTSGSTCGANVCWVGGNGTFTFNSTTCEYASVEAGAVVPAGSCTVTASGSFSNITCGTGSATGTATITPLSGPDAGEGPTTASFSITFANGQGVITGSALEGDGDNGSLAGAVEISPTAGGSPPSVSAPGDGPCTPSFSIASSAEIIG